MLIPTDILAEEELYKFPLILPAFFFIIGRMFYIFPYFYECILWEA